VGGETLAPPNEHKPKYNPNKKGGRDGTHGESTNESGCVCKFLSGTN